MSAKKERMEFKQGNIFIWHFGKGEPPRTVRASFLFGPTAHTLSKVYSVSSRTINRWRAFARKNGVGE